LSDIPINGLPLKLGGAVCLSSAKLLHIIFPTSIVPISANFYFYIQNEKLENKKIIKKIKVLQYLNVTTLANHCRDSKFYL
jgi:cbb3-type cytochrome oxidase cytochrome c subunit